MRNSTPLPSTLHKHWSEGGGVGLWWPVGMDLVKFAIRRLLSDTRAVKLRVVAHNSRCIRSNGRLCVGQIGTSPSVDGPTPPPHQHPGAPPNPMFRYFLLCDTKTISFVTRNQNARTRTQSVSRNTSQPNVSTTDIRGAGTVFLTPCTDSIGDFIPALCS